MSAFTQMRFLNSARINRIIGRLAAQLEIARPLVYLQRLPIVPAFDDELTGYFTGKVFAADLIADDQAAVVQEGLSLEITTDVIPNLKIGTPLRQKLLNRLKAIQEGRMNVQGQNALRDWDSNIAANLLLAVRQRANALACAMMIDAATYDRWGLKITGASWGTPSNLKISGGTAWGGNPTTATPLSDIWAINQTATLSYGISYNKLTMSTVDFRDMAATTEFAQRATLVAGAAFLLSSAALRTKLDPKMLELAQQVLGFQIVLDDATYNTRSNDGTITSTRVLPLHTVLLSRTEDEGNGEVMDMGNAVPTESIVADMIGGAPEGIGGDRFGPVAYYTPASPDLNPAGIVAWGVARMWPRKFVREATATLTVG
jgi:hypothetical protein